MKNTNEHGIIAMYRVVHSIKLVRIAQLSGGRVKQTIFSREHIPNDLNVANKKSKSETKSKGESERVDRMLQ